MFARRLHNKSGTSLVEVLVALVVFLVGILTAVRMFPGGFAVVKHGENVTVAGRLVQAELERWKNRADNLPAGILPVSGLGGGGGTDNLDHFRKVRAEATRIPAPSTALGSIYILGFSPVDTSVNPIIAYSGPMRRRALPVDRTNWTLKNPSEYAIDYDAAKIYLKPTAYSRDFVLNYSYWSDASGTMQLISMMSVPISAPMSPPGTTEPQELILPALGNIEHGSVSLHRQFVEVVAFSGDPYEFKIWNPTIGILAFNPAGYGKEEVTSRGREPLTAYIDYDIADWHIVSEERKVPEQAGTYPDPSLSPDLNVKLSLRFLYNEPLSPTISSTILAVDMETGDIYDQVTELTSPTRLAIDVDEKNGIIWFDPIFAGKTFRIYYRAEGDWGVQVYKAYNVYRQDYGAGSVDYQEYWHDGSGAIGFLPCYSNCTVAVDYDYQVLMKDGSTKTSVVRGDCYKISDINGANGLHYIDIQSRLADVCANDSNVDGVPSIIQIRRVYGVSLGARAIWNEPTRGFIKGRDRKIESQVYLVRPSD